jgi:hypothetical protein
MERRKALQLFGTASAAFATGSVLSTSCTGPNQTLEVDNSTSEPINSATPSAFETETGGRIYSLPRDHAMHGGDWYKGAEYQETHYFTGFFNDRNTGKPYSVFFCWAAYGWDDKLGRPVWNSLFSMTDIERKKFLQAVHPLGGTLTSTGSGPDVAEDAFSAEYVLSKDNDGSEGLFSYQSKDHSFRWMANIPTPTTGLKNQTAYSIDCRARVVKPGFRCPVPYGFTQEGLGTDVANNLANPFTGAALSWYIIAPCMEAEIKMKLDDMDLDLVGQVYYEHQWGRLRIPGMEQARYTWGWARMGNGDILNWRTYRDSKTGKYVPSDPANRFNVIRPDGTVQYYMGPAFVYEPLKWWKSPETGVEYPVYGKMITPVGVFFTDPIVEVAEAQLFNGGMWEGAARLRKDSATGPIVGHSFCEYMWAPFDSPLGKDIPYDPAITASPSDGFPDASDFKQFVKW